MAIEEGPRGNDKNKDEGRSAESDEERKLDVLQGVADDEGDCL